MTVREGLERLEGVASVSKRPDIKAQTCEIKTRDGRLLDMHAIARHLAAIGVGARLRGVEADMEGDVVEFEGKPGLRIGGTDDVIRLAPLTRIIQLDHYNNCAQSSTTKEREAYRGLLEIWKGKAFRIRIVGTINPDLSGGRPSLEVRWFENR